MIEELNGENLKVGLKMNLKKTKEMFNNQLAGQQIIIGNETVERVKEYIYLGQAISANSAQDTEIKRISMGWTAYGKYGDIMNSNLPLLLKRKVYNQCIPYC